MTNGQTFRRDYSGIKKGLVSMLLVDQERVADEAGEALMIDPKAPNQQNPTQTESLWTKRARSAQSAWANPSVPSSGEKSNQTNPNRKILFLTLPPSLPSSSASPELLNTTFANMRITQTTNESRKSLWRVLSLGGKSSEPLRLSHYDVFQRTLSSWGYKEAL